MAIVTRDEVKTFLQIKTTSFDTLIDHLIPQAEGIYLRIRGIDFFTFQGDITNTSDEITDIPDEDFTYLKDLKVVDYDNESYRAQIINVFPDENKIKLDIAATLTEDDADSIKIYPFGAQLIASKIVGYFLSKLNANGLKSESIGTYSYQLSDLKNGIPVDIANEIEEYQTGRC